MDSINRVVEEYRSQLEKGQIQKTYKATMRFMSGLSSYLAKSCPDYAVSAMNYGYLDMSYFAFTPPDLKSRKLKIAVVYRHAEKPVGRLAVRQ